MPIERGTPIRLKSANHTLYLTGRFGVIDSFDGELNYYVVRLTKPAVYIDKVNKPEVLYKIIESSDNMDILAKNKFLRNLSLPYFELRDFFRRQSKIIYHKIFEPFRNFPE